MVAAQGFYLNIDLDCCNLRKQPETPIPPLRPPVLARDWAIGPAMARLTINVLTIKNTSAITKKWSTQATP
jgi:hypothetical protein